MPLRKILVANRGEIAVRIVRAAHDLGIATVQVHSTADRDMLAVRLADEAVEIGPPHPGKSYLRIDAVLQAARETGCDAVHPGYGFLSENAGFATAVEAAGLVFIGPTPETIRTMGDKAAARASAVAAGVPVVPGSDGIITDPAAAPALAAAIGFPVMIKAAAGGGGRGIRVAQDADELATLLPQAGNEARAAFGDGSLYLERFVARARHVEVQVLGDRQTAVICTSANVRCSAGARKCGRRRRPVPCPTPCARRSVPRRCGWPRPAGIAARARSNTSTTSRAAPSSSSR